MLEPTHYPSRLTLRVAIGNLDILVGDAWNWREYSTGARRAIKAVKGANEADALEVERRIDGTEAIVKYNVSMRMCKELSCVSNLCGNTVQRDKEL